MLEKKKISRGAYVPPSQQEGIDLIEKAYSAVQLFVLDPEAEDKTASEEIEVKHD